MMAFATAVLKWQPSEFWRTTPRQFYAAVRMHERTVSPE